MAFCMKCGAPLPENAAACPQCGAATGSAPSHSNPQPQQPPAYAPPPPVRTDFTAEFSPMELDRLRWLVSLCYFGPILSILALVACRDSKLVRFHVNQSLVLLIWFALSSVVIIIPFLGWLAGAAGYVTGIVFMIMNIVRALQHRAVQLPFIGKYVVLPLD